MPDDHSPIRVLVVDDNEDDYLIAQALLEESGCAFHTEWGSSYDDAIEMLGVRQFDVCLVDYQLGTRTGLDWVREDIVESASLPCIMLTGKGSRRTDLSALEAGVSDYLEKEQINSRLLERSIRYAVEKNRLLAELQRMSMTDSLTGAANRNRFQSALEGAVASARRHQRLLALLCVDLDFFKSINDSFGHGFGDQVLIEVTQRLTGAIRAEDLVGRLGGDEFAVLLTEIGCPRDASRVAEKILAALGDPIVHDNRSVSIGASIGVAVFDGEECPKELFEAADKAMYEAKRMGRCRYCYFDHEMQETLSRRAWLERELAKAISRQQLTLNFQPQVHMATGEIVAVEALVRWHHHELGMVPPAEFIPIAEGSDLINTIGDWVLLHACRQLAEWQTLAPRLRVAINVSPSQLDSRDFVDRVRKISSETNISPHHVELEITESAVMRNPDDAVRRLNELQRLGFRTSIDDFGTGFSSLTNLKRLPLDVLKIDRSFVRGVCENTHDETIVNATIGMARSMKLAIVAEGVESSDQAEYLAVHQCAVHQGYLYAPPLDAATLQRLLLQNRSAANQQWPVTDFANRRQYN